MALIWLLVSDDSWNNQSCMNGSLRMAGRSYKAFLFNPPGNSVNYSTCVFFSFGGKPNSTQIFNNIFKSIKNFPWKHLKHGPSSNWQINREKSYQKLILKITLVKQIGKLMIIHFIRNHHSKVSILKIWKSFLLWYICISILIWQIVSRMVSRNFKKCFSFSILYSINTVYIKNENFPNHLSDETVSFFNVTLILN